jgi:hypothetical protein
MDNQDFEDRKTKYSRIEYFMTEQDRHYCVGPLCKKRETGPLPVPNPEGMCADCYKHVILEELNGIPNNVRVRRKSRGK